MGLKHAFLDESGDSGLDFDKPGTGTHFIVTAVLVDDDALAEAHQSSEEVATKHFQGGEIRSRKVGNKHERRLRVLADIASLPIRAIGFVVDKRLLWTEGCKYKDVFHKFLRQKLDSELSRLYPKLRMSSDRFSTPEFMESFQKYLTRKYQGDLFDYREFGFVTSREDRLVQVADFIAGSLAKSYDRETPLETAAHLRNAMKPILNIWTWPERPEPFTVDEFTEGETGLDPRIAHISDRLAAAYITRYSSSKDPDDLVRVECTRILRFWLREIDAREYVASHQLIDRLSDLRASGINPTWFRTDVIAKLRDSGVLIASSELGYKLPASKADCLEFINRGNTTIAPMLKRIKAFREQVLRTTEGELDVLDRPEFKNLLAAINKDSDPEVMSQ